MLKWSKVLFVFIFVPFSVIAQHVPSKERSAFEDRRKTDIDANLIRTTIFNYAITGRSSARPDEVPYEWPKNSRQEYLALTSLMYGAEVILNNGEKQKLFTAALGKPDRDGGSSWELQPIVGYANPNSDDVANQLDKSSWPTNWPDKLEDSNDPGWPGSWNGFFGKNQFNADQEVFFKTGDDNFAKFNYTPDSTDISRAGLGIVTETRVLQWTQVLVQDVLFILHFLKNDGTKDLQRVGVNVLLADLVGGDGDTDDDRAFFDLLEDVAWSTDTDGIGNRFFGSDPVGVLATSFLETPGNAVDNIDNDRDGEENSPIVTLEMLAGEDNTNQVDDNGNGLVDENESHIFFISEAGSNPGNGFRDRIDNDNDGELGSPTIDPSMFVGEVAGNAIDDNGNGVHDEGVEDSGNRYADGIDNDDNGESDSPTVTQEMIDAAAQDGWQRYYVTNTAGDTVSILYDLGQEDLGKAYADGIDNDGNKAIDEGIDEGIDEMIDEGREDGIDNDGDWNPLNDDVGLDGQSESGDTGESDGLPSSGAGTSLPGEPNIDKTDVSESDQLGLTNVQYAGSGDLNAALSVDRAAFAKFLVPGSFYDGEIVSGDFNLFVGTGLFPLKAGQTERISMAVNLGQDREDALLNRDAAQTTYDTDYQFAQAPFIPILTAIPGDGKVTLYWDDMAEKSFDRFLSRLGENPNDFEGYRIYRTTDAALEDAFSITDARGVTILKKPFVQFDLVDEWRGLHPVDVNGAHFDLGKNTGITHTYVDSSVVNGQRYFYAITAYDYGLIDRNEINKGIFPSESPISISVNELGEILHGPNVAVVTPNAPAAGYVDPHLAEEVQHISGASFSTVSVNLYDRTAIKDNQTYRVTFEDTTIVTVGLPDSLKTKNYSLIRLPSDTLVSREDLNAVKLVTDGFFLSFANVPQVAPDLTRTQWNSDDIHSPDFRIPTVGFNKGTKVPYDYELIVGAPGSGEAVTTDFGGPSLGRLLYIGPTNFQIRNVTLDQNVSYAMIDTDPTGTTAESALLSRTKTRIDRIFLVENVKGEETVTWFISFETNFVESRRNPQDGDRLFLATEKPFLSDDVYEFTTIGETIDPELAKSDLDRIKVVPNPYIVAAPWEPPNPFTSGRGPRAIHFNHLPQKCTIRIFNVAGELVKTIEHDSAVGDGTAKWDLLTRDNLDAAYGIYLFHVDAPGIGEHMGRFAIIK